MEQLALTWGPSRKTYTVAELNVAIRAWLGSEFADIWVSGEISGVRTVSSGHCYFTLKDQDAQLRCVAFRASLRYLKFKPRDGVAVLARGRIDVYEARGEYQLLVEALEPLGHGALQFAFDQLKKTLAAEGLFDAARKRPLPRLPQRIGIVTSPTGAVIRDITEILSRRFPGLHMRLYPASVQGEGSIEAVVRALEYFSQTEWADVVILARGGGSLEDLWTFNEEAVARAIAASRVPVISAIGHETDFTIADFVSDLRAPTPSAAAELVICTREQLLDQARAMEHKLAQGVRYRLAMATRRLQQQGVERALGVLHRNIGRLQQRVDDLTYRLRDRMSARSAAQWKQLEELAAHLRSLDLRLRFAAARRRAEAAGTAAAQLIRLRVTGVRGRLDRVAAHLTQLSPLRILERGYAIVTDPSGRVIKEAGQAPEGSAIDVRLARARIAARVIRSRDEPAQGS
ncbi:MAG TPA: exodeoxyribonuclease VII large subunit [Bryobacteraceae bacterium]|nr:exodeoxyribonuclease VII large subunit [Bryobacteraceae bacterium]